MTLKALIFDVDGTLSETEDLHLRAFNETFEEAGLSWKWDEALYKQLLKTTGGKERMTVWQSDHLKETVNPEFIASLHKLKTQRYVELMSRGASPLREGVAGLISDARSQGYRLAIATTTNRPNVDALISAVFGEPAENIFEVIAAGDEVKAKKPAPDVYQLALEGLGLRPEECIAFEDTTNGVISAQGAGLRVVACAGKYSMDHDLSAADFRVESYEQIDDINKLLSLIAN